MGEDLNLVDHQGLDSGDHTHRHLTISGRQRQAILAGLASILLSGISYADSCNEFLAQRDFPPTNEAEQHWLRQSQSYINGFISGWNSFALNGENDAVKGMSLTAVEAYIDNYCRKNEPNDVFPVEYVLQSLFEEMAGRNADLVSEAEITEARDKAIIEMYDSPPDDCQGLFQTGYVDSCPPSEAELRAAREKWYANFKDLLMKEAEDDLPEVCNTLLSVSMVGSCGPEPSAEEYEAARKKYIADAVAESLDNPSSCATLHAQGKLDSCGPSEEEIAAAAAAYKAIILGQLAVDPPNCRELITAGYLNKCDGDLVELADARAAHSAGVANKLEENPPSCNELVLEGYLQDCGPSPEELEAANAKDTARRVELLINQKLGCVGLIHHGYVSSCVPDDDYLKIAYERYIDYLVEEKRAENIPACQLLQASGFVESCGPSDEELAEAQNESNTELILEFLQMPCEDLVDEGYLISCGSSGNGQAIRDVPTCSQFATVHQDDTWQEYAWRREEYYEWILGFYGAHLADASGTEKPMYWRGADFHELILESCTDDIASTMVTIFLASAEK
jgi:hypothetical protein